MLKNLICLSILISTFAWATYKGAPDITQTAPFQLLKEKVKEGVIKTLEKSKEEISKAKQEVCASGDKERCEVYTNAEKSAEKNLETWKKVFKVVEKVEEAKQIISPTTIILRALQGLQGDEPKQQNF